MTIHLLYPHGKSVSCPDAIGRHLKERLSRRYEVRTYEWHSFEKVRPSKGDVLIGHACPLFMTSFRRSCRLNGWKRILLLSPYCHGDARMIAYNESVIRRCDLFLAITGNYWASRIPTSKFSHWFPKMQTLDLAVNRNDFPVIKQQFNPVGARKILFIARTGFTLRYKNIPYLRAIADAVPEVEFGWIGSKSPLGNIKGLGTHDFSAEHSRKLVSEYDFLITVGRADANPTTILEAMAWGLIPVCTPQSGYEGYKGIVNVPLDFVAEAAGRIRDLLGRSDEELREMQEENWRLLDSHFNWDRFAAQVIAAIDSEESPMCLPVSLSTRLQLSSAAAVNPFWRTVLSPKKVLRKLSRIVPL